MPDISKASVRPVKAGTIDPLKSSNVRYLSYDPKTKHLDVLFDGGKAWRYVNVDDKVIHDITKGATTVSSGESALRAFFAGKEGSKGAAFDQIIKKGGVLGGQLDPNFVKDKSLFDIMNADRISKASKLARPFYEIIEKAKIKQKLPVFKEFYEDVKDLDDEAFSDLVFQAEELLKSMGKRKTAKQKKLAMEQVRGNPKGR